MKMKKIIYIVLGIAIILFAVIIVNPFSKTNDKNYKQDDNSSGISTNTANEIEFPVTASVVRKGELITWINTSGYAYPVQGYEIKPNISGQVNTLNAFNGEEVKKGDLLFKLDDAKYKLDLEQAKNNLVKAQVEYELQKSYSPVESGNLTDYKQKFDSLKSVYNRAKKLYKDNKISYDEFSRIERDYETLKTVVTLNREDVVAMRSGLTDATINFEKAEMNLNYANIASPISGLVADCNISKGDYVDAGNLCMRVINITSIKMQCQVTESDLVKIHTGDPVEADFIALPNKKFNGRVIEVNPSVDLTKRTATITVLLINPGLLIKPGMFASVKIGTRTYSDVLLIPHSSLLVRENRTLVFTIGNGLALWQYVTIGLSNDEYYEVKKGLKAGDTIIVGGNYNLAHQSKVRITSMQKY